MKWTTATVRALPPGTHADPDLPGHTARIRESGYGSFEYRYKTAARVDRRLFLGSIKDLGLGESRELARDAKAMIRLGRDPFLERQADRDQHRDTFSSHLPSYLKARKTGSKPLKPRSLIEVTRHLVVHAKPLHSRPIAGIDKRVIAIELARVAEATGESNAGKFRAALSGYWRWLQGEGIAGDVNPVAFTNPRATGTPRNRVPTADELKALLSVVDAWSREESQYADIVLLLLYLGLRRNEIGDLRWSEINVEAGLLTLPPARTKNSRPHLVPLTAPALEILKRQPRRQTSTGESRDLVFGFGQRGYSGWSKSAVELNQRLVDAGTPIPDLRLHDLRRVFSTVLHERLKVQPHIVEELLGHAQGRIAATYNLSTYEDSKRHALSAWDSYLASLRGEAPVPNVATLAEYRK